MANDSYKDFGDMEQFLGPEDEDIREHLKSLEGALKLRVQKKMQARYEAMSSEQLRQEILAVTLKRFCSVTAQIMCIIGALKVLDPTLDVDPIVREHCEFEVKVLRGLETEGMPEDFETATSELTEHSQGLVQTFVDEHTSGEHVGCMFDEYTRRSQDEWPEEVGGE